jgi:hypothetical protein
MRIGCPSASIQAGQSQGQQRSDVLLPTPNNSKKHRSLRVGLNPPLMRRAKIPPATAATYATNRDLTTPPDAKGQTHGSGGRGVSARVPGVRRRYPADRVTPKPGPVTKRLPAGAGPRRTGGSQAGEGQDGFAPRTAAPPPVSPARGPPTDWGELVQVHFRPGDFSGVTRRAVRHRHRHPQPLTAFHATVRTAREKSGFKAGSSQREKPGLERG